MSGATTPDNYVSFALRPFTIGKHPKRLNVWSIFSQGNPVVDVFDGLFPAKRQVDRDTELPTNIEPLGRTTTFIMLCCLRKSVCTASRMQTVIRTHGLFQRMTYREMTRRNMLKGYSWAPVTVCDSERYMQGRPYLHSSNRSTSLVLYDSLKEIKSSPLPALVLGLSGLIPFVAAPGFLVIYNAYYANIAFAQAAYGASILSFLGGVRWGFAVPEESSVRLDWTNMCVSVIPSLVAWVGLLLPDPYSLLTIMIGLAGVGYYDIATWGYPNWFKGLRFVLTFVAVLSLWSTFMCKLMLKSSDSTEEAEKMKGNAK